MYIDHNGHITLRLTIIKNQQLITFHLSSVSWWGRWCFIFSFPYYGSQYFVYEYLQPVTAQITEDTWPTIIKAPLMLILEPVYP